MKAVVLLFCLALPRDITGNIFRKQYPNNMVIQKVLYFDQPEQPEQNDSYLNQDRQDVIQPQMYRQQNYQRTNPAYEEQQMYSQKDQQQTPTPYGQQVQERFQEPMYNQQEQQKYQQSTKPKKTLNKKKSYKQNVAKSNEEKTYYPSEGNSLEDLQRNYDATYAKNQMYAPQPRFADIDNKPTYRQQPTGVPTNKKQKIEPAYGDLIEWKGLRMAVGPYSPVQNKLDIQRIFEDAYKTMQPLDAENKMKFHVALESAVEANVENAHLNATGLIRKYNYPVEEHIVRTKDGYNLTIFRINKENNMEKAVTKPVVFLMHGLLGSADDWLLMGPEHSLAFLLADAGFDVWLGNSRGNRYSRHASKHPAQDDYWQYSIDEIALYDLPAMIDRVLEISSQQKLYYIGHSQGNTVFFALASTRPEYNDKITMMYAMSPMVYMSNVRSPLLRMIAPTSPFYEQLNEQLGNGEFRPKKELIHTVGGALCLEQIGCKKVCSNMYLVMAGIHAEDVDMNTIQVVMGHLPAGASMRQIRQYGQAVASGEFRRFDYGPLVNQELYGQVEAPKYEMKRVSAPVVLYYSEEDWLAHPMDVDRLRAELPNVQESYKVPEPRFDHIDFQFSSAATQNLYKRIIDGIQRNATQ